MRLKLCYNKFAVKIYAHSLKDTEKIGIALGEILEKKTIVMLCGELGSGKTTLIKYICKGMGIVDESIVKSPTYTLMREYDGPFPIYHFDLYRLKNVVDLEEIGYYECIFDDGITFVEWADRIKDAYPQQYLQINIEVLNREKRIFEFKWKGKYYDELMKRFENTLR